MQSSGILTCLLVGLAGSLASAANLHAGDPGVVEIDTILVQVSIDQGNASFTDVPGSAAQFEHKLSLLAERINSHLAATEAQEERQFSDYEGLNRGTNYARKLVAKVRLLQERVTYLGDTDDLAEAILSAVMAFDVPQIKQCLQEILDTENGNVAEAAFQLGGFQELDGEYQDAWGNYQKASNLEPENQLYMDAHGKNEF